MAHDLSKKYLKEPGYTRIPILFNLRNFTKTLKIESLVTSFLDDECEVSNPKFRLFKEMNDAGLLLLIFDGFDEMAVRVDRDILEINLQEIEKLAASPRSKVIMTSRMEYFISQEEEHKALLPKKEILASRSIEYEAIKIQPWDDKRIKAFLQKRVQLIQGEKQPWTFYSDRIRDISGLSDLSKRPVLLDMIVKTLPQLIASGKPVNRPNLYETYLKGEIKRQKIKKQRTLLLSEDDRFDLLKRLALDFFKEKSLTISFDDSLRYMKEFVKPPKSELESYTRDFLSCSFLIREVDNFRFSHKSILEYLIAKALMDEIETNSPQFFSCQPLESEITDFLVELEPDKDALWNWLKSTADKKKDDPKYLGGNSATLLCKLDKDVLAGKDLSKTNLTGADLSFANLIDTNLSGTILKNVTLRSSKYLKKDLINAMISDIEIYTYYLAKKRELSLDPIDSIQKLVYLIYKNIGYKTGDSIGFLNIDSEGFFLFVFLEKVENRETLNVLSSISSRVNAIEYTSIYYDEFEKLSKLIPDEMQKYISQIFY